METSVEEGVRPVRKLLNLGYTLDRVEANDWEDALGQLSDVLITGRRCKESFHRAIIERERVHPSGLPMSGPKIAIPHTDAHHVIVPTVLFARLKSPVEVRSMGDPDHILSVQLVAMFALTAHSHMGGVLTTLIRTFQDAVLMEQLLSASDRVELYARLRDGVKRHEVDR